MSTEDTIYDNGEETRLDNVQYGDENREMEESPVATDKKKMPTWQKVTIGGVSGIVLGGLATMLMSATPADATPEPEPEQGEGGASHSGASADLSYLVEGDVEIASGVTDDMSFNQAFAEAREEVGPGGVFQWRGGLYGTYYASEWEKLTPAEREEWNNNFAWSNHSADEDHPVTGHGADIDDELADNPKGDDGDDELGDDDDIVASVDEFEPEVSVDESEIQVLGVAHHAETGANIGMVSIDGQEAYLIDVEGDEVFEDLVADVDGNGTIDNDEIADISEHGITVDALGGFTDMPDDDFAMDNDIDYTDDGSDYIA